MHIHQSTSALLSVALFIRHFPHNVTVHNKIAHLSRKKEKENKLNTRFQTCWCKEDTWCIVNANEFPVNTMEKRPPRVMHPAVHSSQKKKQNKKTMWARRWNPITSGHLRCIRVWGRGETKEASLDHIWCCLCELQCVLGVHSLCVHAIKRSWESCQVSKAILHPSRGYHIELAKGLIWQCHHWG